jgi:2-haloacid dehalogenase
MAVVLAFDVYGTLIDTDGVRAALEKWVGDRSSSFARLWREKQLEYAFRRGLMQEYRAFSVCTRDALEYACLSHGLTLDRDARQELMAVYRVLPAFGDAGPALQALQAAGCRIYAFSNGEAEAVRSLLRNASLERFFLDIVSVDEVETFKPSPAVYRHFLRRSGARGSEAWLISSNPFDVIGGLASGLRAAWVRRSPDAVFDPWGYDPTLTLGSLLELEGAILGGGPG